MNASFLWPIAYNWLGVPLMWTALRVGAAVDGKVRAAYRGRKKWLEELRQQLRTSRRGPTETLWFHMPSVGEYEQAKPIMRALYPEYRIVATCFSPSVIEMLRRFPYQDAAIYLPLDSRRNVRRLFDQIAPKALVFSKFDVWPNCVWEARRRGVPLALIAGTLHRTSRRLRPGGRSLFRELHGSFAVQCAVSEEDAARLRELSPPGARILVTGDTRFDAVYERASSPPERPLLPREPWEGAFVLVAGSTYLDEERKLIPQFAAVRERLSDARLILVPHEPTPRHLEQSEAILQEVGLRSVRYSQVEAGASLAEVHVVLVDRVGLLAHLYGYGDVAYVGGSFRARVHNVMEPAVLERPILIGPYMDNSPEAYGLIERGAILRVETPEQFQQALVHLAEHPQERVWRGRQGREYILQNLGATERTLQALRETVLTGKRSAEAASA